ncbi:uncharacterized protein LOC117182187 [Belonocnema kinseyi]|uniref:uncharacterized protein LOC117182187 n=1 Tax=Belonocnema kinseyi TaxID=2817044 RepID=UPI00143DAC74|nr:uncharacterized protein LOC117182187 [Belonocnema kinseyi]
MVTNIEPSVIVINNKSYGSATSSDSDFRDAESSLNKSQPGVKIYTQKRSFRSISRRMSKQSLHKSSYRNDKIYPQANIEASSTSKDIVPSVIVMNDNLDESAIILDSNFHHTKLSIYKSKSGYRVFHLNSRIQSCYNQEEMKITEISESPDNYRRRLR